MEHHIKQIELINQYINGQLSEFERRDFENQLQSNSKFNKQYQDQLNFLQGLKRVQLKAEINSARKNYKIRKWLKIIGLPVLIIGLGILCYGLFYSESKNNNQSETIKDNSAFKSFDSIKIESDLNQKNIDSTKHKFVVIKKIETQLLNYELTKAYGGVEMIYDTTFIENLGYFTKLEFKKKFQDFSHLKPINDTIIIKEKRPYISSKNKTVNLILSEDKNQVSTKENRIGYNTPDTISNDLLTFYQSVKKAPQIIEFNNEKPFEITCNEGTKLTIPAKSFIDEKTGKLARGIIKLEVTEYYKLSDILLANLTTKSYKKQLETGGMLYIKANKNGRDLKLKPRRNIGVKFPDKEKRNMQLFSGIETNTGVNWKLQGNLKNITEAENTTLIYDVIEEETPLVDLNVVEVVPVFPGCEKVAKTEQVECLKEAINKIVTKNFNKGLAEDLNLNGKHRIKVTFTINKEGKIDQIKANAAHIKLAEEAVRVINLLPQMTPAKQRGKNVNVAYFLPIIYQIGESSKIVESNITFKGKTLFEKKMEVRLISKDSTNISGSEYSRYAFTVSGLGWINCDRFVSAKNRIKFKVKIKDAKQADVKLVFKSIRSILPSIKYDEVADFGNVPLNEDVILIAIKKVDDKLFLGIKETTIKPISELDLEFKEVTLDRLKAEFKSLDTYFK